MAELPKRKLGAQGLEVSALGLGCMGMSQSYGDADENESVATIHRALDLGVTFFDTAEAYGPYRNEELLGKTLAGRRKDVVIATKFGFRIVDGKMNGVDSRPEHVREALEGSLSRLRTDYVDLFYQHRVDPTVPIEDVVGAMSELVREGKHPISALQSEYSLWERNLEARIIPVLRELHIGLVPFAPLGRGFLAGNVRRAEEYPEGDFRRDDPRFSGKNFDANMRAAEVVRDVARRKGATPAQVALAWLLHKGDRLVPIPGTKRRKYLEENVAAAGLALSAAEIAELDRALAPGKVAGPRYNEQLMATIDR